MRIMPQNRLKFERPRGLFSGFGCWTPEPELVPELAKIGEQWAPPSFAIPGHAHPRWEFYLQTSGTTEWSAGRRRWSVASDALLAVPPGVAHSLVRCCDERHAFVFAELDLAPVLRRMPVLAEAWAEAAVFSVVDAGRLRAPFARLVHEAVTPQEYHGLGLRQALDVLVLEITRLRRGTPGGGPLPQIGHAGIARARSLLEQRCAEPWREAELARLAGLSPAHFRARFTAEVGATPRRFLEMLRVERAGTLLRETDLSVTEVALETGFATSQHFARIFRRRRGVTPRGWRHGAQGRARV